LVQKLKLHGATDFTLQSAFPDLHGPRHLCNMHNASLST